MAMPCFGEERDFFSLSDQVLKRRRTSDKMHIRSTSLGSEGPPRPVFVMQELVCFGQIGEGEFLRIKLEALEAHFFA